MSTQTQEGLPASPDLAQALLDQMTSHPEAMGELAAALTQVQAKLPTIPRAKSGQVGNRPYTYADLDDVSSAVLPLLAENGLAWTCLPILREDARFVLRYFLIHTSGGWLGGDYPLGDPYAGAQIIGGHITYGRRYTLGSATGATTDEDTDASTDAVGVPASAGGTPQAAPPQPRSTRRARASAKSPDRPPQAPRPAPAPTPTAPPGRPTTDQPEPARGSPRPPAPSGQGTGHQEMITPAQRAKLWPSLRRLGIHDDAAARAFVGLIIGHRPASSNDLTKAQASKVLDQIASQEADLARQEAQARRDTQDADAEQPPLPPPPEDDDGQSD